MKIINLMFFSAILLLSTSLKTNGQWVTQESGVTVDLLDVCFVDSLHGWIVGDSTTILATNNGGETWVKQHSELEDTWHKSKIEFINKEKGFCGGGNGLLFSTIDGGNNWIKNDFEFVHNISDIEFVDENIGWITAWIENEEIREGIILKTIDGGNNWSIQLKDSVTQFKDATKFMSIEFLNNTTGWAMGGNYHDGFAGVEFYYTDDGGANWNIVGSFDHGALYKLKIASQDTLWGGGYTWLSVSIDAGKEWRGLTIDDYNYCFEPINGKKGWAFQSYYFTNTKRIFYTLDGGTSWEEELNLDNFINEMTSYGENNLWIVGAAGFIMKRTGSITSINENYNTPQEFYLEQNYPNPFNPSTKIKYSIPVVDVNLVSTSNVVLKVYDILGCEVATLVNKEQKPGSYEVKFNANDLASGLYFYKIATNGFTETKKMILLR